jgi:ADP-heptose:LPS heptosyltransferase
MRLDRKRALDFWIGRPVLSALQVAARIVAFLLRRNHAVEPVRTVLLVKFQGLGSLVICKPAIANLRKTYPNAHFIFWGTPGLAALAREMPEFDEILVLDDRNLFVAFVSTMGALLRTWRRRIDWAFDLEVYSRLSSVLVTLTCARNRAGFALEVLRARRVHTHLVYFNRYRYVGEAYARLIGQMTPGARQAPTYDFGGWRFELSPLESVSKPYFVFNVHAGDLSLERRWPIDSFRFLIDALLERSPTASAVLIGHGAAEVRYAASIPPRDRLVDLSGKLSLRETMRLLANADLVVTNDTGPLHLALATTVPIVGLFGPTRGETYVPPGRPRTVILQESIYCSPCVHHWEPPPCGGDNQCMQRLSRARALAASESLLGWMPHANGVPEAANVSDYYPGLVYSRQQR